jgi:hypothetical protein
LRMADDGRLWAVVELNLGKRPRFALAK